MRRTIEITLLLCALLAPWQRSSAAETLLETKPVPLSDKLNVGDRVGHIRFLGMLELPNPSIDGMRFSQLSGLAWDEDDGILYAISDKGLLFHLRPVIEKDILTGLNLLKTVHLGELVNKSKKTRHERILDAEGLDILHGHNGRKGDTELIISFEGAPRIVRYRPDGKPISEYLLPAPFRNVKNYRNTNRMLESVCVDSKLGILSVPEVPLKNERAGYTRIFNVEGKTWFYPLSEGNRITALECLGKNKVMVLESNFTGTFGRLLVMLRIATLPTDPSATEPVSVENLVTLDTTAGHHIDNFEGLARHRGNRFFLVSDDNDLFIQRSLLMYFEVLDE
jgi:hypothetical protein